MIQFAQFLPSGEIVAVGATQESVVQSRPDMLEVDASVHPLTHYISNRAPVKMPPRPTPDHVFDYGVRNWVDIRTAAQKAQQALDAVSDTRRRAYPSLGDQMDMLWHAMDANVMPRVEPFYSQIKAVKDANPKPPQNTPPT
jgi:hypothetical protein